LGHHYITEKSEYFGGKRLKPDYLFLEDQTHQENILDSDDRDYFSEAYVVGEAKDFGDSLDQEERNDQRRPKRQIFNYVDRTRIKWGILTNGRKWRLYCYEDLDTTQYFEIDLINLVSRPKDEEALEKFKLFYLFFRQEAFLPEDSGFADKVLEGSDEYAEELEDSLEGKIYSALEEASRGFFNTSENDLDEEEDIDLVHRSSLILLYRLLFILNAESRGLLPVGDKAYDQTLSLDWFKDKIIEEPGDVFLQDNTKAWDRRITDLFEAINEGQDLHTTKIPPYNGGLFAPDESEENRFLSNNQLRGDYLKEVVELLALRKKDNELRKVDYRALDIKHLGSIYEGLLEHKLMPPAEERLIEEEKKLVPAEESSKDFNEVSEQKKVEKGQVYLANESGERKATGSYYTPDYIVEYIVENTLGPKIEDKLEDHPSEEEIKQMAPPDEDNTQEDLERQEIAENKKIAAILDLNICDPAMGSGHFLTEATEYLAKEIYHGVPLRHQGIDEEEEELTWAKRQVVQNCIYGVDINPLATELAKLSLWIETMSKGKPLNFLDHHLKIGNSLVGSKFEDIFTHPENKEQKSIQNKRFEFGDPQRIKESFKRKYEKIEMENSEESVDDVKKKEEKYKEFREDTLYRQLKQVSNIHTSQYFEKEVSVDKYEGLVSQLGSESHLYKDAEWVKSANREASIENKGYFHWELEFPKVFFGDKSGFDAVIGNPPYDVLEKGEGWTEEQVNELTSYIEDSSKFEPALGGKMNLFRPFEVLFFDLAAEDGKTGHIIPMSIVADKSCKNLREWILKEKQLISVDAFPQKDNPNKRVFPDAKLSTSILIANNQMNGDYEFRVRKHPGRKIRDDSPENYVSNKQIGVIDPKMLSMPLTTEEGKEIAVNVHKEGKYLEQVSRVNRGEINQTTFSECITDSSEDTEMIKGAEVGKYILRDEMSQGEKEWINKQDFLSQKDIGTYDRIQNDRIATQQVTGVDDSWRILATKVPENTFLAETTNSIIPDDSKYTDFLLGVLNSRFMDWRFRITSTNNHVATYELKVLPIPNQRDDEINKLVERVLEVKSSLKELDVDFRRYIEEYSLDGDSIKESTQVSKRELIEKEWAKANQNDYSNLKIDCISTSSKNLSDGKQIKINAKLKWVENIEEQEPRYDYTCKEVEIIKIKCEENLAELIEYYLPFSDIKDPGKSSKTTVIQRILEVNLPKIPKDDLRNILEEYGTIYERNQRLQSELNQNMIDIDSIVFGLFDLSEEDVETILGSLNTPESEKKEILKSL
jgi:Alw26I/Eco31I/Esp3I family type II restriction m6 adenine DNA methyltransferase